MVTWVIVTLTNQFVVPIMLLIRMLVNVERHKLKSWNLDIVIDNLKSNGLNLKLNIVPIAKSLFITVMKDMDIIIHTNKDITDTMNIMDITEINTKITSLINIVGKDPIFMEDLILVTIGTKIKLLWDKTI